jgi:hypothetical protein
MENFSHLHFFGAFIFSLSLSGTFRDLQDANVQHLRPLWLPAKQPFKWLRFSSCTPTPARGLADQVLKATNHTSSLNIYL